MCEIKFKILLFDEKTFILKMNSLKADIFAELHSRILGFPEKRYKPRLDAFLLPQTSNNIAYLKATFSPSEYEIEEEAFTVIKLQKMTDKQQGGKTKRRWEYLFNDSVPVIDLPFKTQPFKQQVVGLDALHNSEYFALLMEMGTGKTKIVIDEICWQGKGKYLIVCPKSVQSSWIDEFNTHAWKKYFICKMRRHYRGVENLVMGLKDNAKIKVWVVNYEGVSALLDPLMRMNFDMVVLDESAYVKNRKAKRTKAIQYLGASANRRCILNGTPAPNTLLDLYSQFDFLKPGVLGFSDFNNFKREYARYKKTAGGFDKLVGYANIDKLKLRMSTCSFFVKKAQCLDLPEKLYVTRKLEMSEKQASLYEQMLEICLADLEGNMSPEGTVSASVIIVQLLRLSQIACGFLKCTSGDTRNIPDGNVKLAALKDIIEESEGKVIVWARFKQDVANIVDMCKDELNIEAVCITGAENDAKREYAKNSFNSDGGATVLVGNPATGGLGLTLLGGETERCNTVVYYSNDFSAYKRLQSEDRNHRIGLRNAVTYYDLICEGTVEERILKVLLDKKELNETIANYKDLKGFLLGPREGTYNVAKKKKRDISEDLFNILSNSDVFEKDA